MAAKGKYTAAAQLLTEAAPQMLTVQDTQGTDPRAVGAALWP